MRNITINDLPHWKDGVTLRRRLYFILQVIYRTLIHKRRQGLYYFHTRLPFAQDCCVCGKPHIVWMEDPCADKNDCEDCFHNRNREDY